MLFLAKRQLLSRKIQTLLIMFGILLGSAAYVVISGMMLGFQTFITNQLINNDAHIRVSARENLIEKASLQDIFFGKDSKVSWIIPPSGRRDTDHIENPAEWMQRLRQDKNVEAFAPQLIVQALLHKGKLSTAATIIGTDPKTQTKVTNISEYMTEGDFFNLKNGGNRIILGDGLLAKMGSRMGGTILVTAGGGEPKFFKIVGVFHVGAENIDDQMAYANLSDVQKIHQTPNQISDIAIRLRDIKKAHEIANMWTNLSHDKVQSWDQSKTNVMAVFKTQTAIRYFMTISILLVAGFGIYNVLSVLINQKKKEIAILRAMGFAPREIRILFLYQGITVGFVGGSVGLLLGFLFCRYLETLPLFRTSTGEIKHMIISYDWSIYVFGFFLAFLSALVASVLPAQKASKMTPIDIIRESS